MSLDDTKKAFRGWDAIKNGKQKEFKQQVPQQQKLNEETNFKPGDENSSNSEFSLKKVKQFLNEKYQQEKTKKVFKGSAEQCMLKLATLFGTVTNDNPESSKKFEKGKVLLVEEAGLGMYKITYIPT